MLLSIVAGVGILVLWVYQGQNAPQFVSADYGTSRFSERASDTARALCGSLDSASQLKCIFEVEDRAREAHRSEKDLRAQRFMAIYGAIVAIASVGTFAVTFVGLVWIKETLDETKRAADITDAIGQKQTRPYLTFQSGSVEVLTAKSTASESKFLSVDLELMNCGQSPARVSLATTALYWPKRQGGWGRMREDQIRLDMIVGPNQSEQVSFFGPDENESKQYPQFVVGFYYVYRDFFGNEYDDHVWLEVTGNRIRQDFSASAHGYELTKPHYPKAQHA